MTGVAPYDTPELSFYLSHLIQSYRHFTGRVLVPQTSPLEVLYHAPVVVVAHDTQPDPVFCYANRAAQQLWGMEWAEFTHLPSRLSAQPDALEDRQRLLERAQRDGYVDDYQGIRVTSAGKRFMITGCVLWNVADSHGNRLGQAAMFDRWQWLD